MARKCFAFLQSTKTICVGYDHVCSLFLENNIKVLKNKVTTQQKNCNKLRNGKKPQHHAGEIMVCLKSIALSPFSSSFPSTFPEYRNIVGFEVNIYFTDHQTANTIQLFVAIKGNFSGLLFFDEVIAKGNSSEITR